MQNLNYLSHFNLVEKIKPESVYERYLAEMEIKYEDNIVFVLKCPNYDLKGKFIYHPKLGEVIFEEQLENKSRDYTFVSFVAKLFDLSYHESLVKINFDFGADLIPLPYPLEDFNQDFKLAKKLGLWGSIYFPEEGEPRSNQGTIYLSGNQICSEGGICVIIGQPGAGKSNLCEVITSKAISPEIDGLGFSFSSYPKKVILIDSERGETHLYKGWNRLIRRCNINHIDASKLALFCGMKNLFNKYSMEIRWRRVKSLIMARKADVVIIDGVAKLVDDINNLSECVKFVRWLSDLAEELKISLVVTIHANPNDMKAQGHLGSALLREAESVFALQYNKSEESSIRVLTTKFPYGKVRSDKDKIEVGFVWSDEHFGFVTKEIPSKSESMNALLSEQLSEVFSEKDSLSYTELYNKLSLIAEISPETARKKIPLLKERGLIHQVGKMYHIVEQGESEF